MFLPGESQGWWSLVGKRNGVASGKLDIDIEAALSCQTNNDRCESKDFSYDVHVLVPQYTS